ALLATYQESMHELTTGTAYNILIYNTILKIILKCHNQLSNYASSLSYSFWGEKLLQSTEWDKDPMSVLMLSKNPHGQAIGEDFSRRELSFY
ncbi:TPA: hypothetical protein ACSPZY_000589, partial [Aeromonas veronii]